jgi:hypothetical protein
MKANYFLIGLVVVLAGCETITKKVPAPPKAPWLINQKQTLETLTKDDLWVLLLRARKARQDLRDVITRLETAESELEDLLPKVVEARMAFKKAVRRTNESEYQKFYVEMDAERKRRAAPWISLGKKEDD